MTTPLFNHHKAIISTYDMSQIDSGDRRSVVIEFNNILEVGAIIELMDSAQIGKDERLRHSQLCFITAIEQSPKIARGYCLVHFVLLQQAMPRAMYSKLIKLQCETELQQEQIEQMTDLHIQRLSA